MKKHCNSAFKAIPMLLVLAHADPAAALPRLSMSFQGAWDSSFSTQKGYQKGDVVSYNNALYQSLVSKNKLVPTTPDATKWRKVLDAASGGGSSGNAIDCAHPGPAANLIGCIYSTGTELRNQDLRGAQLLDATLAGDLGVINLDGANLAGAKLGIVGAGDPPNGAALTLQGGASGGYAAKVRGTNFSGSNTPDEFPLQAAAVDFRNANLSGINWPGANLEGAFLHEAILVNANLPNFIGTIAHFSYADLRSANLDHAKLDNAEFFAANLTRAQLVEADLSGAIFVKANLSDAIINASYAESPTKLAGADFSDANLTGADFTGAIGGDTVIYTAATRFDGTICPDGAKVNGSTVTNCQGHGFGAPQ